MSCKGGLGQILYDAGILQVSCKGGRGQILYDAGILQVSCKGGLGLLESISMIPFIILFCVSLLKAFVHLNVLLKYKVGKDSGQILFLGVKPRSSAFKFLLKQESSKCLSIFLHFQH